MSFATELFVFILLPIAVIGYRLAVHYRCAVAWLLGLSLAFYASAGAAALAVVLGSAIGNYLLSRLLLRPAPPRQQMLVIGIAIVGNLLLLGYFKYFGFLTSSLSPWLKTPIVSPPLALPLGISFFTFQQIAYLIDVRAKRTAVPSFRHYLLFATFFPQATSGPINYWHETVPQYERLNSRRPSMLDFSVGLTVFAIGLFKKTVFAEPLGQFVDPVFDHGDAPIAFLDAWTAALAFLFQLYFDFSGYTDMAIGIARMFGIRLPINFNSPLKATSLVDFWRRWHMTMTRFFTDYVYSPLALHWTRQTMLRRDAWTVQFLLSVAAPTAITFLLIGWWHGPQWTYLVFGVCNALALIVNQLWRSLKWPSPPNLLSWFLTIGFIIVAVVLFRAPSLNDAIAVYRAMLAVNASDVAGLAHEIGQGWINPGSQGRVGLPLIPLLSHVSHAPELLVYFAILAFTCLSMPNTHEIMTRYDPALAIPKRDDSGWLQWYPGAVWSLAITAVLTMGIINIPQVKEFIYVQF